ncbi:hypothetical protein pVco7_gp015 [Vibrio phage pVco-7]|uniref:Uncharacterized protein n=1 Tax=Vibrio phage pVco-5 TaxID=1965485 RepID=A0A1W6JUP7_9CAUD|nr:hypothetical protein KNT61_gp016 [Vibrio phage pVco-5]ARM71004.1 hypothetical protein pVco5_016 [Vibrio phage pVco-5]
MELRRTVINSYNSTLPLHFKCITPHVIGGYCLDVRETPGLVQRVVIRAIN